MRIVVLGGGSTGEHFVGALRRFDTRAEITLVESRLVGGECSYWACMPTKTMLRPLEAHAAAVRAPGAGAGTIDPRALLAWRDAVAERDDARQVAWLADHDCALVRGRATVTTPGLVSVEERELPYDRLVVATGSAPVVPPIPGLDRVPYWTNVEATETLELPRALLILGGGPVGCEFAQFFARLGSAVTLVERGPRLLESIDADAEALLEQALVADGVEVMVGAEVERIDGSTAVLAHGRGERRFDRLLLASGRRANTDGFAALPLTLSARGIEVDARMRAAPGVWAIGDVTGIAPFTHVGKYHARIAAADIAGRPAHADYTAIPATIFTDPQVATVGRLEGRISTWPLTATPRLATYERPKRDGFVKVAADPSARVLTGAVAVGPEAGEWLQQLTLAIRARTPTDVLLDVIQPYPTFSEAIFLAPRELDLDLDARDDDDDDDEAPG